MKARKANDGMVSLCAPSSSAEGKGLAKGEKWLRRHVWKILVVITTVRSVCRLWVASMDKIQPQHICCSAQIFSLFLPCQSALHHLVKLVLASLYLSHTTPCILLPSFPPFYSLKSHKTLPFLKNAPQQMLCASLATPQSPWSQYRPKSV